MKYRVVIQPTAKLELREAYRWFYDVSSPTADRWLDNILKAVGTLTTHPERCPLAPENDDFAQSIRQLLCGKKRGVYRVLFTIKGEVVHILHIRHAARQYVDPLEEQ